MEGTHKRRSAAERRKQAKKPVPVQMEPVQETLQEYEPTTTKKVALEVRPSSEPISENEDFECDTRKNELDQHNDTDEIEKDLRETVDRSAKILHSCDQNDLCHTDELALLHMIDQKPSSGKDKQKALPIRQYGTVTSERARRRDRDAQFLELKRRNKDMESKLKESLTKRANEEIHRIKQRVIDQSEKTSVNSKSYYSAHLEAMPIVVKEPKKKPKSSKPKISPRKKSRSISVAESRELAPVKEQTESRDDLFDNALRLAPEPRPIIRAASGTNKRRATLNLAKALNQEVQVKRPSSTSPRQKSPIEENKKYTDRNVEQEKTKKKIMQANSQKDVVREDVRVPSVKKSTTPNKKVIEGGTEKSWNFSTNVFKDKFKKKEEAPPVLPKVETKPKAEIPKIKPVSKKVSKPEMGKKPVEDTSPKRHEKVKQKPSPVSSPYMKTKEEVISSQKSSARKSPTVGHIVSKSSKKQENNTSESKKSKSPIKKVLEKVKETEQASISSGKKRKSIYEREYDSATAAPSFRQILASVNIDPNFQSQ